MELAYRASSERDAHKLSNIYEEMRRVIDELSREQGSPGLPTSR